MVGGLFWGGHGGKLDFKGGFLCVFHVHKPPPPKTPQLVDKSGKNVNLESMMKKTCNEERHWGKLGFEWGNDVLSIFQVHRSTNRQGGPGHGEHEEEPIEKRKQPVLQKLGRENNNQMV